MSRDIIIKSIKGKLPYTINHVTKHEISFSAPTRNEGEAEVISLDDFTTLINRLSEHQYFNTSSAKELFKGTKIYRKRSPFFGLLLSANVIERI